MEVAYNPDCFTIISCLLFMVMDFASGLVKAAKNKAISSTVMREGLFHKASLVLVILLAIMCEVTMTHFDIGMDLPLVVPVCAYIVLMEVASILENVCEINPQLSDSKVLGLFKKKEV